MEVIRKAYKLQQLKKQYKRSNKYMLCFSYEDIGDLIKMSEDNINYKKIPNYMLTGERITISERLYAGLVRSLAWKIEYQNRIERATSYLYGLDSLDINQFNELEKIIRGD